MYTVTKTFHFCASRTLSGFALDHSNLQVNSHIFHVTFELTSIGLNRDGYIIDLDSLIPIENFIVNELHKKHLNDVLRFNPTNENLAKFFFKKFKKIFHNISAVIVTESGPANITAARYILSHDEEDNIELDLKLGVSEIAGSIPKSLLNKINRKKGGISEE